MLRLWSLVAAIVVLYNVLPNQGQAAERNADKQVETPLAQPQENIPQFSYEGYAKSLLLNSFRASRDTTGVLSPYQQSFYTPTSVFSRTPPACGMQVLTVVNYAPEKPKPLKQLWLSTQVHFMQKNDGSEGNIAEEDLAALCEKQPIHKRWFTVGPQDVQESIFAAWIASGALHAVASGRTTYAGVDLSKAPDQAPPVKGEMTMSIKKFSEAYSDDISGVTISTSSGRIEASVGFGGGPTGGCALKVRVVSFFEIVDNNTRSERRVQSIDIGKVGCYTV